MEAREYWEIVYYGTGMSPQRKHFTNEAEALETWAQMKDDPYAGASILAKITTIDEV
jgi:hypothetical protein